ncbi:hypothetical protein [Thauera chlorobenzoica]|uniref:Uncharacterized protein n=1 Tax=Thauera chlorobenzoica TaxID=96773 RepID=A0A1H5W5E1_9RHOO|nr:hypothetical protein [Thauera chlorobenzoica]APR03390.1 hypothetical protein Tchl_0519 [Thauera chlorobenzoica]SEF94739.1 hypothetical protein SAMN05216242_110107 [Thauera chlorobenzoica]
MNTTLTRKIVTALICGGILAAAAPAALADRGDHGPRWSDHGPRWGHQKHYSKHDHKHRRHWDERTVYREKVIIRERPRYYREPVIHNHYYERPYRSYSYSRSPAVVIGVDIPPLVIPLR